jgi:DNA-directed RNA polymerase specialized sigma24 family protein
LDVSKILDLCSPRDRTLFQLQLSGVTMAEIAEEEGVSITAIRIRYFRARRAARAGAEARTSERRETLLGSGVRWGFGVLISHGPYLVLFC